MKKTIIVLFLALLAPTVTFAQTFKIGDKGIEVVKLQKILGIKQTGFYGVVTKKVHTKYLAKQVVVTSTPSVATSTSVIATSTFVIATSTPVKRDVKWNFELFLKPTKYESLQDAKLMFTPIWTDTYTLAPVTRCVWSNTAEEDEKIVSYSGDGYVEFTAVVHKKYPSKVYCVAFAFENGVYKEYKSSDLNIK
jgi:hypothetical protein